MSQILVPECEWCRELDYALWWWKRVAGEDEMAHKLTHKWGIDLEQARVLANVTARAYKTAADLWAEEDATKALEIIQNAPVVAAGRDGLIISYSLYVPQALRELYVKKRFDEVEYYRDFVALNPDPLLHQQERVLDTVARRLEGNLEKVKRYQRMPTLSRRQREMLQKIERDIREDLDRLKDLQSKVSHAMRDPMGRFRPGTAEYQRLWTEIREYIRTYTRSFEYLLRAVERRMGRR
jgi:exonuclease VII large subunit